MLKRLGRSVGLYDDHNVQVINIEMLSKGRSDVWATYNNKRRVSDSRTMVVMLFTMLGSICVAVMEKVLGVGSQRHVRREGD